MRRLFSVDPDRHQRMSLTFDWLLLDYSKNRITDQTLQLLFQLAREANLNQSIGSLFDPFSRQIPTEKENKQSVERMFELTEKLHTGQYLGFSQKPITDIVNIGIASSGLGPRSVCEALRPYHQPKDISIHFIADGDGFHLQEVLGSLDPETTLFIVSSRAFSHSSPETMTHAETAKRWLLETGQKTTLLAKQFIALTAAPKAATSFGIPSENIFQLPAALEQRHTDWLATGLPLLLSIGINHFKDFLDGVTAMDEHFRDQPFEKNMPVILAMIGIWYNNFFATESHAILPYDYNLRNLPRYVEQIDMQSNGKSLDRSGNLVGYATGPIIWGGNGLNNQHGFYQMLHRGQKMVPADFIVSMRTHSIYQKQHNLMFANAIAQTEALMRGRTLNETINDLVNQVDSPTDQNEAQIPHCIFGGNNPSNTLLLKRLTPKSLGILLTLYEHKTYTQSAIWNLGGNDQSGIELGNTLSNNILRDIFMPSDTQRHDASTNALINHYRNTVYPR